MKRRYLSRKRRAARSFVFFAVIAALALAVNTRYENFYTKYQAVRNEESKYLLGRTRTVGSFQDDKLGSFEVRIGRGDGVLTMNHLLCSGGEWYCVQTTYIDTSDDHPAYRLTSGWSNEDRHTVFFCGLINDESIERVEMHFREVYSIDLETGEATGLEDFAVPVETYFEKGGERYFYGVFSDGAGERNYRQCAVVCYNAAGEIVYDSIRDNNEVLYGDI